MNNFWIEKLPESKKNFIKEKDIFAENVLPVFVLSLLSFVKIT